jgi:hypothetical protein
LSDKFACKFNSTEDPLVFYSALSDPAEPRRRSSCTIGFTLRIHLGGAISKLGDVPVAARSALKGRCEVLRRLRVFMVCVGQREVVDR